MCVRRASYSAYSGMGHNLCGMYAENRTGVKAYCSRCKHCALCCSLCVGDSAWPSEDAFDIRNPITHPSQCLVTSPTNAINTGAIHLVTTTLLA